MTTIAFLGAGSVVFTRQLLVDILGFGEVCPDAWVLNYTNPMAMNIAWWGHTAPSCAALNHAYLDVVAPTVSAAQGRRELVRQAAMVDPNTSASLSLPDIWQLCDELTEAHGDLLPADLRQQGVRVGSTR